jgi:hypothetical protein
MSPVEIIELATSDGLLLAISPSGGISAKGERASIERWLPTIQQSKAAIIAELGLHHRRAKVVSMLREKPSIRYALEVIDPSTDPVIVVVGIRNLSTFEMSIPNAYFDGFGLLELIQEQTADKNANV